MSAASEYSDDIGEGQGAISVISASLSKPRIGCTLENGYIFDGLTFGG